MPACRRASFPRRTPASCAASPRRSPTLRSRKCRAGSRSSSRSLQKDPAVESVTSAVGFGGATNKGFLFLKLKPKEERGPMFQVMARLRAATSVIPGIRTLMLPVQNLEFTGGRIARAKYQYTLQSGDQDALFANAPMMEREMGKLPGLRDVNSDLQISNPQTKRRHRPREGRRVRHQRRRRALGALQRLRQPADLDHLHAGRRLSGHPGSLGEVPERSRRARPPARRHALRRARAARRGRDACSAPSGRCRSTGKRSSRP